MKKNIPTVLCILDGWGISSPSPHNAIANAKPKFFNSLLKDYPNSQLFTSGEEVGLPKGQMGNSEVGHMTMGSGRVIEQDLLKINRSISDGSFFDLEPIHELLNNKNNSCHLIGLLSDGGVHSHINHILAIAKFLNDNKIKTYIHAITDGRDTLPESSKSFIEKTEKLVESHPYISIATISGRFYSMDRDNRKERTEKACRVILKGENKSFTDAQKAISDSYSQNISDEFIIPQSHQDFEGVKEGDKIVFTNFRADRMRQIVKSVSENLRSSSILTMIPYSEELEKVTTTIITRNPVKNTLSEIVSNNGLSQLKIAETEKYAHVTFFFNSGKDERYKNEDHILIDSPKVKTYDLKPEMSAKIVTKELVEAIQSDKYDFLVVNYANADMVGHTGNYDATLEAIRCLDKCLEDLTSAVLKKNGTLFITADHGNAEIMFDNNSKSPYTSHTLNPVPFIVVNSNDKVFEVKDGTLSDIAPTILKTLNIKTPEDMTGKTLIKEMHNES